MRAIENVIEKNPIIEKNPNADHLLKVWDSLYGPLETGAKNFEVRLNDRCYSESSVLHLCEWDRLGERFTGRSCLRRITYILYGGRFGVEEGYVVLGLAPSDGPGPTGPRAIGELSDGPDPVRQALAEAHAWLDNGKCLWGDPEEFDALMGRIEATMNTDHMNTDHMNTDKGMGR